MPNTIEPWYEGLERVQLVEKDEKANLSAGERIAIAQVYATLSVGRELSKIAENGVMTYVGEL